MKGITPKKSQIDKNQTMIFAMVAVSAIVVVASLVISRGLWGQSRYYSKVIKGKEAALSTLEKNQEEINKLTDSYNTFNGQSPNLMGGNISGSGDRDGSNSSLVLGALPNLYDFPALISSVEKMLTGYSVEGITGSDDVLAQSGASSSSGPVEVPFSFAVDANYDQLKSLMGSFDRSIRPFSITKMEISGSTGSVKADISAKTYYQPDTSLKITEEVIQ